jgi:hypothetical protein
VGIEGAQALIFLERAAIYTTVLAKGYVVPHSELQGKKRVGLKPLFPMPAITYL